jgi:hypothetical protein
MRTRVVCAKCLDSGGGRSAGILPANAAKMAALHLSSQSVDTTPVGGGTNRIYQGSGHSGKSYTFFSIRSRVRSQPCNFVVLVIGRAAACKSTQIPYKFKKWSSLLTRRPLRSLTALRYSMNSVSRL